jgi:osmotically-inducible protein OsmY
MKYRFLLAASAASLFTASGSLAAVVTTDNAIANDSYLTNEVASRLASEPYISELPLSVSTADGIVVISGWVADVYDEARIVAVTYGVKGVAKVHNKLKMVL